MTDRIVLEATTNDDGKLVIDDLPPKSKFRVIIEEVTEGEDISQQELDAIIHEVFSPENIHGQGKKMGEIEFPPPITYWKGRKENEDSVDYINRMRQERRKRRLNRD